MAEPDDELEAPQIEVTADTPLIESVSAEGIPFDQWLQEFRGEPSPGHRNQPW